MGQAGQHGGVPPSGLAALQEMQYWRGVGTGAGLRRLALAHAQILWLQLGSLPFQTVVPRGPTETARAQEIWGVKSFKGKNLGTEARGTEI